MSLLQIGKRKKAIRNIKDRVYLSFSSEGYGHSSRAIAIAGQMSKEEVVMGSYNYALQRVDELNFTTVEVPQELKFIGSQGSFDVGKTILHNPARALGLNQTIQEEMEIMEEYRISGVVADGRMAPVLAASRLNLPCLVLTNQSAFYPFFERESELVKIFGRSFEWVMKLWLCSAEEILIPDFPPPYTVCLPNLSENYQVKKRTRFVGPLVAWKRDDIIAIEKPSSKPLVVASLGGHSYRRPLFDAVLTAAEKRPDLDFIILASFESDNLPENVTLKQFVQNPASYFKAADVMITQAGHSTAMEVLTLGKPTVIIPDSNQIEQENNARRMKELGVSELLTYKDLNDSEQTMLINALDKVLSLDSYKAMAQEISDIADEIHGAKYTAQLIQDYAHRLAAY